MLLSLTYLFWGSHLSSYNFSLGFSIYVTDGPNLNCHHGGWVHWRVEPSSHSGRGNLRRGNRPFNVCSIDQEKPSFNDAYKVKLLVNKENGEACAMKEVSDSNHVTVDTCFKVLSFRTCSLLLNCSVLMTGGPKRPSRRRGVRQERDLCSQTPQAPQCRRLLWKQVCELGF